VKASIANDRLVITENINIAFVIAYISYTSILCRSFQKPLIMFVQFSFTSFKEVLFEEVAKIRV